MPDFHFNEVENERLQTAIMSFQRDVQPASALPARTAKRDYTVQRPRAGAPAELRRLPRDRRRWRRLPNASSSDPTLAPPLLTPEGAKVQPDWLYAFLQAPITIRPWLDVRMPTFGLDDGRWNAHHRLLRGDRELDRIVPDLRPCAS